jgi:hypothetical protein
MDGLQDGILKIRSEKIQFTNKKPSYSKKYVKYLEIDYKDIYGYAHVMYGFDKLPWKLEPEKKPSEFRCWKFTAKVLNSMTDIHFCVMNERQDWDKKVELAVPEATYVNDIWVSQFNYKVHLYNLAEAQKVMVHTVKELDCNSHIMESIKYEYRNNVLIIIYFSTYG